MMYSGLPIKIEYQKGDKRPYRDDQGKKQHKTMHAAYGFVRGTKGVDGDELDVYICGPDTGKVFVVKQMKRGDWKTFDEEKCMLGCSSAQEASGMYLRHYNDHRFLGGIKEMTMGQFKDRVAARGNLGQKIAKQVARTMERTLDKSAEHRATTLADRVDEAGLLLMASPYIAKGVAGTLKGKQGVLGSLGRAAQVSDTFLHRHDNKIHPVGLALVAPSISRRVGNALDRVLPKKVDQEKLKKVAEALNPEFEYMTEQEKVAYLGAIRSFVGSASGLLGSAVSRGRQLASGTAPAVAAATKTTTTLPAISKPEAARKGNIAKATAVGTAGLGLYAGKKTIDTVSNVVGGHGESMAPPAYQGPRL